MGSGLSKRLRQIKEIKKNYEEIEKIKMKRIKIENDMINAKKIFDEQERVMNIDRESALSFLDDIKRKNDIISGSVDNVIKINNEADKISHITQPSKENENSNPSLSSKITNNYAATNITNPETLAKTNIDNNGINKKN